MPQLCVPPDRWVFWERNSCRGLRGTRKPPLATYKANLDKTGEPFLRRVQSQMREIRINVLRKFSALCSWWSPWWNWPLIEEVTYWCAWSSKDNPLYNQVNMPMQYCTFMTHGKWLVQMSLEMFAGRSQGAVLREVALKSSHVIHTRLLPHSEWWGTLIDRYN